MTMKRRDALKTMGALAGAATMAKVLPGCGDSGPGEIKTVVVMMMENRTYDHWFGARKLNESLPGDGLTAGMSNPDGNGGTVEIYEAGDGTSVCDPDPPHGWAASHAQFNAGANDGFLTEYRTAVADPEATNVMAYMTRDHIPVSWALADAFCSCDRYFCSVMGPTWPNRMYWHAGTSHGINVNELPSEGFDDWISIYHRLVEKGVEYAYYYGDVPVLAVIGDQIEGNVDRMYRMEEFYKHAEEGSLPPVVYIDPAFSANDDHPPHHPLLGQQLISSVVAALQDSPQWHETLFVLTYDEHGGYFDHVPPPTTEDDYAADGFDQMGFRVPTLVIGPWVKQGVVSTQFDHTSVLKHIINMHGLDGLGARTDAATDLTDCLDLERMAAGDPLPRIELPEITLDDAVVHAEACTYELKRDGVLGIYDQAPDRFGRALEKFEREKYLRMIGDQLAKRGLGGFRKG